MTGDQSAKQPGEVPAVLLQNVLAAVLRKFVKEGDKVKINLASAGNETDLVIDLVPGSQKAKISWHNVAD